MQRRDRVEVKVFNKSRSHEASSSVHNEQKIRETDRGVKENLCQSINRHIQVSGFGSLQSGVCKILN